MGKLFRLGLLAVLAVAITNSTTAFAVTTGGSRTARPLVTAKVDDTQLVSLAGNTHPAALEPRNDRGAVADDFAMAGMLLQLKRSPEQEKALGILMDQLHTSGNPNYHKWLSEAQYDESFGVNTGDVTKVVAWLRSHGFTVDAVTPDGMVVQFSGTAGNVREAFHTDIHNLQLPNGEKHFANITDPEIPSALAGVVVGPTALHNFMPHPLNVKRSKVSLLQKKNAAGVQGGKGNYTFGSGNDEYWAFVPGDEQVIYNIKPLLNANITGKGQTIGLIEDEDAYNTNSGGTSADWTSFVTTFGLSSYGGTQTTNHPTYTGSLACTDPGDQNDGTDFEVALDIQYASASAPGANVVVESCPDTNTAFGGLIAVENLVSAPTITAPVLSISYGECEAANGSSSNAAFSYAYQHGAARGVSIFVSSGDESAVSCDADASYAIHGQGVSGFTSTPYNVSVGGTDFGDTFAQTNSTYWSNTNSSTYESALSYVPEIPWNDSCASELLANYITGSSTTYGTNGFCNSAEAVDYFITTASGSGGPSGCYSGAPSTRGVVSGTCKGQPKPSWQSVLGNPSDAVRDIPDVSLFASNGIWSHYIVLCFSNTSENTPDQTIAYACTGAPSGWSGAGGTSASSPMMAGIQTLVNQYNSEISGNPNYVYYKLAAKEYGTSGDSACNSTNGGSSSCIFYDITQGDMNVPCTYYTGPYSKGSVSYNCYDIIEDASTYYFGVGSLTDSSYNKIYGTTTGWDFATGIGSVNAYNLATNWKTTSAGGYPFTATVTVSGSVSSYVSGSDSTIIYTTTVSGTGSYPTGTVTLKNGSTTIGTGTLTSSAGCTNGGTCSETAAINYAPGSLAAGTYTITATYSSTNENYATASGTTTLKVTGGSSATTTTAVTSTPNPVGYGQSATLKATVTASSGTATGGTVSFTASGYAIGTCTLAAGTCSITANTVGQPIGTYFVVATYAGTTGFTGSTSPGIDVSLNKADTTTTLVISPSSITPPAVATLTATVARPSGYSGNPTGNVNFYDGSDYLATVALSGGKAVFSASTSGLQAGTYTITAKYVGDAYDNTSSGTFNAVVK